jgi:RNA methyltransferase, TrmH family
MSPQLLGVHNRRLTDARRLLKSRERRTQGRFLLEGPTVLAEAFESGVEIESIFVTAQAFKKSALLRELDQREVAPPIYLTDDRIVNSLSDVATPAGIVAVGKTRLLDPSALFEEDGRILVLADLNDAGNAGTLVRAADAFGVSRIIFGNAGVEPYHPKVVRSAAGSLFRTRVAVGEPATIARASTERAWRVLGLSRDGEPIGGAKLGRRAAIVVGHERHGLGRWQEACERLLAIPTPGPAESLNAAVAGAIALYEASRTPE